MSQIGAVVSASSMGAVLTITGDTGFPVGPDGSGNIDLVGGAANVSIDGDSGTNTITVNVASSVLPFNVVAVNTNMAVNNAYFASSAVDVTLTLPVTSAAGSIIQIIDDPTSAGDFVVAQNAGQSIWFSGSQSTVGVAGGIQPFPAAGSTAFCIELICVVADTTWVARNNVGSFVPF